MNISSKILLYTLTTAFFTFLIGIGIVGLESKEQGLTDAKRLIDAYAREYANLASKEIHKDIATTETMAKAIDAIKDLPYDERTEIQNLILKQILAENSEITSTWISWELSFVKDEYKKNFGRRRFLFNRSKGQINTQQEDLDLKGDNPHGLYYKAKLSKKPDITDPYNYTYNQKDSVLETSVMLPLIKYNKFIGLVGIDISLDRYQNILSQIHPYEGCKALLLAENLKIIAGAGRSMRNKSLEKQYPNIEHQFKNNFDNNNKAFSFITTENGIEYYVSFAPVRLINEEKSWIFGIAVPTNVISQDADERLLQAMMIGGIGLGVLALVIAFMSTYISRPLKHMARKLRFLEKGIFHSDDKLAINSSDEIGEVARSVNTIIDALNSTTQFATEIGNGKLDTQYKLLSDEDTLGKALLDMRTNLLNARLDEELRRNQEDQQAWVQKGVADSGMILRQRTDDFETFGYNIISFLVKYVKANQGGFFIVDDLDETDVHIKLAAAFAYDKRKIRQKRMELNEGIIGRAVLERETIYMTNIPENYFKITSGFGETLPKSLIVLPLAFENEVYGIVEIASFEEMELYQIQFLEQVAERVAAFLANLKKSIKTSMLLEESQRQSHELAEKEKKYRKQFEVLYDEHLRLNEELGTQRDLATAANNLIGIAYFNKDGVFQEVNGKYIDLYFTNEQVLIGNNLANISSDAIENPTSFDVFWQNIQKGAQLKRLDRVVREGTVFWIEEFYSPIFLSDTNFDRIICFCWDVTEYVTKQEHLHSSYLRLKAELEKEKN